jgi:ATP-dependent DNA helicase RecG
VCASLNRNGGYLFLGANDDSLVIGIDKEAVPKIKKDFITFINNAQKISPTFYLTVEEVDINNKTLLYIYVPESSQVHRCNGRIYDRNEDGDIDITENTNLVSALYMKKQGSYMENKIYPFANYQI